MATLNIKNFDDQLYAALKERAARQRRSVAQEVAQMLSDKLAESAPASLLDLEGLGKQVWEAIDAKAHITTERASWD